VTNQTLKSRPRITRPSAVRVLRRTTLDALLGGACGSVYGLMFAGLGALLYGEPEKIMATALYFGACGIAAGAVVGAFGAIIIGETASPDDGDRLGSLPPKSDSDPNREFEVKGLRRPVNRLAGVSASTAAISETRSSRRAHDPSWN